MTKAKLLALLKRAQAQLRVLNPTYKSRLNGPTVLDEINTALKEK